MFEGSRLAEGCFLARPGPSLPSRHALRLHSAAFAGLSGFQQGGRVGVSCRGLWSPGGSWPSWHHGQRGGSGSVTCLPAACSPGPARGVGHS